LCANNAFFEQASLGFDLRDFEAEEWSLGFDLHRDFEAEEWGPGIIQQFPDTCSQNIFELLHKEHLL
jgi:hypothetical protein